MTDYKLVVMNVQSVQKCTKVYKKSAQNSAKSKKPKPGHWPKCKSATAVCTDHLQYLTSRLACQVNNN